MHIGGHKERNSNIWYVSWWPGGDSVFMENSDPKDQNWDEGRGEGGPAHVVYQLFGGNVSDMKIAWDATRTKDDSHYDLLKKSCSTIVARIIKAGGHHKFVHVAKRASYTRNLWWTPKDVAQFCNQLRDRGYATKTKSGGCPTKGETSKLIRLVGLR